MMMRIMKNTNEDVAVIPLLIFHCVVVVLSRQKTKTTKKKETQRRLKLTINHLRNSIICCAAGAYVYYRLVNACTAVVRLKFFTCTLAAAIVAGPAVDLCVQWPLRVAQNTHTATWHITENSYAQLNTAGVRWQD